jgi:hypothetical protein
MVKRFTFWCALSGYVLTVLCYYAPLGAALNERLFRILPFWMCIFTTKKGPLLIAVAYVIAPINAVIYGSIGAVTGWLIARVRKA